MKNILIFTAFLLIAAGSFVSCKKDDDIDMSKIDFSNIENLYAQPLLVIQKCVEGKWEKKGTYGGFSGWLPAPDGVFIEINSNKLNDSEFQWKAHTKQGADGSFKTYAIQYVGFAEPSLYFIKIKNDSLGVGYAPNLYCVDCFTGELWVRTK